MNILQTHIAILLLALAAMPFLQVKWKGIGTVIVVLLISLLSGFVALNALLGKPFEHVFEGTFVTGAIPIRMDALSAWFVLLINFTIITGALYGLQYMKAYRKEVSNLTMHCTAYLLVHSALLFICLIQNALAFLFVWEIMTLSCFVLIVFEYHKQTTLKAGINFLIQSHLGVLFLTIGFIWVYYRTGSYDFEAIKQFSVSFAPIVSLGLFFCFFIGFGIKAGFVPFHTWLPYAHPASPSHISGIMSGVIIKIGIFGILRMIQLIQTDYNVLGYGILFLSVISGIYGVMLAIVQHNLKKLLAYHSIENIGIIGIGIGLGALGLGQQNTSLVLFGFGGALLHVLNHSLFKSLLFYAAGNVYQATHTMNIEHFGGLSKQMPHTSMLFLVASLAICGLPPLNGFVSEFMIYSGLLEGIGHKNMLNILAMLFSIFGLVAIGGLAILCFTKAFGTIFLGNKRHHFATLPMESNFGKLMPMYMALLLIVGIGFFPDFFVGLLNEPLKLFSSKIAMSADLLHPTTLPKTLQYIGYCSFGLLLLTAALFTLRKAIASKKTVTIASTWGCGYVGETEKMQYTASSFIRSYRKLVEPLLSIKKKKIELEWIFPTGGKHETHPHDKIEILLIEYPWKRMKLFFGRFRFLQNGNAQFYIMYGSVFITLIILIPWVLEIIQKIIYFLNQI